MAIDAVKAVEMSSKDESAHVFVMVVPVVTAPAAGRTYVPDPLRAMIFS